MAKIMLSGQADEKAIERVRSVASGAFIAKPWDRERLKQAVTQSLSK
jgi:FixJ family two-component response regulator